MAFFSPNGRRRCSTISKKTVCKCFTASILHLYKIFIKILIQMNVNISSELNFSDDFRCIIHWVASKVNMNPFGVHSLCMWPNVVYTSINLKKNESHSLNEKIP